VSGNSGTIDFNAARLSGREFCFMRVGRGVPASGTDANGMDKLWPSYVSAAKSAHLHRGGYWRFFPSVDANKQVDAFVAALNTAAPLELPPLVDIEDQEGRDQATMTTWAARILARVEAGTGVTPLLYTYRWFLANALDYSQLARYPIALAAYTGTDDWPDPRAVYWQYTGNSRVPWAPNGPVDFQRTHWGVA
jgi:lysozyme